MAEQYPRKCDVIGCDYEAPTPQAWGRHRSSQHPELRAIEQPRRVQGSVTGPVIMKAMQCMGCDKIGVLNGKNERPDGWYSVVVESDETGTIPMVFHNWACHMKNVNAVIKGVMEHA